MATTSPRLGVFTGFALTAGWMCVFAWYCATMITAAPYQDDWAFVAALEQFLNGGVSTVDYLFLTHNGHPSVPSRALIWAFYSLGDLRFDGMRMISAALFVASAAATFPIVAVALRASRTPSLPLGTRLFWFFPALLMIVSLGHWELMTIAVTATNVSVLLFSLAAITMAGRGLRQAEPAALVIAAVCALVATVSLSHGALVWFAIACQALIASRRRPLIASARALCAAVAVMFVARGTGHSAALSAIPETVSAALIAAGTA